MGGQGAAGSDCPWWKAGSAAVSTRAGLGRRRAGQLRRTQARRRRGGQAGPWCLSRRTSSWRSRPYAMATVAVVQACALLAPLSLARRPWPCGAQRHEGWIARSRYRAIPREASGFCHFTAAFYRPRCSRLFRYPKRHAHSGRDGFRRPVPVQTVLSHDDTQADTEKRALLLLFYCSHEPVLLSTNGTKWDGPYTLKFRVPKPSQNKPVSFFNEGVVNELNREGTCDRAICPYE